jgi:hypothetical protein
MRDQPGLAKVQRAHVRRHSDDRHDDLGSGGKRRRRVVPVRACRQQWLRLRARAVIHMQWIAGCAEPGGHRAAHDAKADEAHRGLG